MVLMTHSTSSLSANVNHLRKAMIGDIMTIWQGSGSEGSLSLTVSFLLAPYNNGKLTFQEAQEIH